MNIKKNFLSRIARRKGAGQAEPEERHGIPPPSAIEPFVPNATGTPEDKGLGSHRELELVASGEPAPSGSADGADAVDGGDAPAPEALSEPPRGAAPYEEYGLELELLSDTESEASPEEPELSPDDASLEEEAADDAVAGDEESLRAPVLQDSPDEDEPPLADEEAGPETAGSAAEAAAPAPGLSRESEPAGYVTGEVGEPLAAPVTQDSPDESLEPAPAEIGIFPLVRDARGAWRPGRGFSRGELREAGLSPADAPRLHIRFDKRRRNTHPVNVASLEQAKNGVRGA